MDIHVITRETIKPSSPTPDENKILKLCLFDSFQLENYFPLILFYSNPNNNLQESSSNVSAQLKNSLSETLTIFYPLAGRRNDHFSITCNDEGALYLEATVNLTMAEFLKPPRIEFLCKLLPPEPEKTYPPRLQVLPQLLIQVNTFSCGGIAIGLINLHTLLDACSCSTFLKTWATICNLGSREEEEISSWPDFSSAASFFPPRNPSGVRAGVLNISDSKINAKCPVRRFLFNSNAINGLKEQAKEDYQSSSNPTRYQALSSFIFKHMILACRKGSTIPLPAVVLHVVDMRRRMGEPFSENSMGNLLWPAAVFCEMVDETTEIKDLVRIMRGKIGDLTKEFFLKVQSDPSFLWSDEFAELMLEGIEEKRPISFSFTSWGHMGFKELNFGWGKPLWLGLRGDTREAIPNTVVITETSEGLEAWVAMNEPDMAILEKDLDFLRFALLNPNVSNM